MFKVGLRKNKYMLAISLYKNKINYIKTSKLKNNDFSVTHHGIYKYENLNKVISCSLKDIVKNEKITTENSVSIVLDSQFCLFNEIFCEDPQSLDFHNNLSGNSKINSYLDSYYYPIGCRDDHYMGIHIDKNLKQQIFESVDKLGFSIRTINVGIFSADKLANFLFNAKSLDNYLLIRFITSSSLEILYINDGLLSVYARYKIINKKIKSLKVIGNKSDEKQVKLALDQILKGRKSISNINKAFVYQSSGYSPVVKNLINKKHKNVVLLNLFNYENLETNNQNITTTMAQVTFSELGQLFGGINV